MSHYRHKRRQSRSRSRSSMNKQESQQDRLKDYGRRVDSYERYHPTAQSNRQYEYRHSSDLPVSIDQIISNTEEQSPVIQTLVREILFERKKRLIIEEKFNIREHDYAHLYAQHEQAIKNLTLLKHDYDQCRLELKTRFNELNALRHNNHHLRIQLDHFDNERQPIHTNEEMIYTKQQRRH